jgi:hypothetical protein
MASDRCRTEMVTFYIINATSLVETAALQQLATDLIQFQIGLGMVTETWFTSQHCDQLLDVNGYVLCRKDHSRKKGRGLPCMFKSGISSRIIVLHSICIDDCSHTEVLWVECIYIGIEYTVAEDFNSLDTGFWSVTVD